MSRLLAAVVALGLAGCTFAGDRRAMSQFEPTPDGFKMLAKAVLIGYAENDPDAEVIRMGWLEQYLYYSKLCPTGYKIAHRKAVRTSEYGYDIYYVGKCT